ncbi:MAG: xylose isomerase [Verrucomicrobia bacterium 21-51-4]|nr:MAG: xylose isomerase [Verrucomicrobia bacterium 21-51-4]
MPAFPNVSRIPFEGPTSRNPLAFKHYNAAELVAGKPMAEHLRFSVAFWHTMRNTLADPFGRATAQMPWDDGSSSLDNARRRLDVFFEFLEKIGIDYYCFHDFDIAPEGATLRESFRNLDTMLEALREHQSRSAKKLLWGTANLFAHPRYVHGAATSPSFEVYAYACAQVKKSMEITHHLDGGGYVFWGGREGYTSLLNTDMQHEREQFAEFLHMAVRWKHALGFKGQLYIEPKPKEPTAHQYDFDAATCLNFLREFDLIEHFALNLETNHATLAGHSMLHEMQVAAQAGKLGSLDANRGDPALGWDTDQFPTDLYLTTQMMLTVLEAGGLHTGGLNFDARRRRESFEPVDLFYAHIGGMDAFARGLKIAAAIQADGELKRAVHNRYRSWAHPLAQKVMSKGTHFAELEAYALAQGEPQVESGHLEKLENLLNSFL